MAIRRPRSVEQRRHHIDDPFLVRTLQPEFEQPNHPNCLIGADRIRALAENRTRTAA